MSAEPKSARLPSRGPDPLLTRGVAGDEKTKFRADDQARSATPELHVLSASSRIAYNHRDIKTAPRSRNPSVKRAAPPQTRRMNNQIPRFPAISPNGRSPGSSAREKEYGTVQAQKLAKSSTYQ